MHLAQREIVELERQVRSDVRIGCLLVRQDDVETDRFRPGIRRAPVGRFHDRRAAPGADDELPLALLDDAHLADQTRQLVGFGVVLGLLRQPLDDQPFLDRKVLGSLQRDGHRLRRGDARRAVHDQHRADAGLVQQHFRLQQLELEAHRPQFLAQQEVGVPERQAIGRMKGLRGFGGGGLDEARLLLRRVEGSILDRALVVLGSILVVHALLPAVCPAPTVMRRR
jgi:hypothetical protein